MVQRNKILVVQMYRILVDTNVRNPCGTNVGESLWYKYIYHLHGDAGQELYTIMISVYRTIHYYIPKAMELEIIYGRDKLM